jgi:hypothetical protein
MKIKGNISILINQEHTTIEIHDADASIKFLSIQLSPEQLSSALSRLSQVPCVIDLHGLDKIGKKMEHKIFAFKISKEINNSRHAEKLREIAQSLLTDGWIAEGYFASQNTFFERGGKQYARCVIRRWV